jgi:L-lysine exporter family protein LysE/ArgO
MASLSLIFLERAMGQIFIEGFLLQASLIFALGAQNLYVLESGLQKRHCIAVSFTCFFCDFFIIMLGVLGTNHLLVRFPQIKIFFGLIGIGFMIHYGLGKLKLKDFDLRFGGVEHLSPSLYRSILQAMTFSIVNPHAYLDGIVLIGGYASKYDVMEERAMIGIGASLYSLLWFLLLSYASSSMLPFLREPRRMKWAMNLSGMLLILLSFKLGLEVYGWLYESLNEAPLALQTES